MAADPFADWPNLAAMMLGLARQRGEQPMLHFHRDGTWQSLSWAAFGARAAALAAALHPRLDPGARVLLVGEPRPELPIANVALQAIGAVPVPAYVTNTIADHAHLLADSGARAVIASTAALARTTLAAAGPAGLSLLICMEAFDAPGEASDAPGTLCLSWDSLVGQGAAPEIEERIRTRAAAIPPDHVAVLMYTSGTGGAPKGVEQPHRAILSNCRGAAELVAPLGLTNETYLSILPLAHSYEYTVGQYFLSALGCQVTFARGIDTLAADMRTIRPHVMTVVPRILEVIRGRVLAELARGPAYARRLFAAAMHIGQRRIDGRATLLDRLADPLLDRLVRARVRARFGGRIVALVSGGARLDPEVGRFFQALGLRVMQGYGQTEAGPVISCNPPFAPRNDTVGPPLRGVDLRIAADGEILVRGDLLMLGYLGRPQDTAETIRDGWLHTGDIGEITDGYLRITDRKKDIIVLSGGENVSPARIEALLMSQPAIAQAVVTGDGASGLAALLVAAEDATPDQLAAAVGVVNAALSGTERIRRHRLVPPFTLENGLLTPTQKIRRRLVIAAHA